MLGAYGWAFVRPVRKLYYNLTITATSIVVAFVVGGLEALNLIGDQLGLTDGGGFWGATTVELPAGTWRDVFEGRAYESRGSVPVATLLDSLPFAVLRMDS